MSTYFDLFRQPLFCLLLSSISVCIRLTRIQLFACYGMTKIETFLAKKTKTRLFFTTCFVTELVERLHDEVVFVNLASIFFNIKSDSKNVQKMLPDSKRRPGSDHEYTFVCMFFSISVHGLLHRI